MKDMRIGTRIAASLLVCAGLLTAFSMSPAIAQDEDFCRTYAYEALEASKQYRDSQCGGDLTKYSLNEADHYNVCMSWGAEAQKYASQSTNARAQEFYNCKAEQAGVAAIDLGNTEYENDYPRPGDKFGFCSNYAFWATTQRGVSVRQGCNFSEESGRWDESFNRHRDWCMGLDPRDGGALSGEINNRTNELVQCQLTLDDMDPTGKSADECVAASSRCEDRMGRDPTLVATQCAPRLQACLGLVAAANAELEADLNPLGKSPEECVAANARCENRMQAYGVNARIQAAAQCTPIFQMCLADAERRGGGGGGGGDTRTVDVQGTTVYVDDEYSAETGEYLHDGDVVTIVGPCPGKNDTCQISAPFQGYIDSKDLKG